MGLPELTFSLKKAADTVATRVSAGIVAMILRDAKANGVHAIYRESDIPADLGADNIAAIISFKIASIVIESSFKSCAG